MKILKASLLPLLLLVGCGGNAPSPASKITGPPVETLSNAQLDDIDAQCFVKFGSVDDPRVTYAQDYCRRVEVERNHRSVSVSKADQDRNQSLLKLGKPSTSSADAKP